MIAVMIAAAMCAVPLFVIEDSEAEATVTTGEKAYSFKGDSIKPADWEATMDSDELYNTLTYLAYMMFGTMSITPSDITLSELNTYNKAMGEKVTDSQMIQMASQKVKYKVSMTLTLPLGAPGFQIFDDGAQDVYREFNNLPADSKVIIEDMVVLFEMSQTTTADYVVNEDKNLVFTKKVEESSQRIEISFSDAEYKAAEVTKKVSFDLTTVSSTKEKDTYTYYTADLKDEVDATKAVGTTKVLVLNDKRGSGVEAKVDVTVNGKNYSDSDKKIDYSGGQDVSTPEFSESTAAAAGAFIDHAVAPTAFSLYGIGSTCLFNPSDVKDPGEMDEAKLKTALEGMGTVSTEFSDAESITDNASDSVSGSSGGNNIIFYVIIGVLAVAVVALAVILIKKK